jgi:hypothetical protein
MTHPIHARLDCLLDDEEDIFRRNIDGTNHMSDWEFSFGQLKEEWEMMLVRWHWKVVRLTWEVVHDTRGARLTVFGVSISGNSPN